MKKFAKLYEFEDIGQVLVVQTTTDEGDPCVEFSVSPEGFGVCTLRPIFNAPEKSEEENIALAEKCFDGSDPPVAYKAGKSILVSVGAFMEEAAQ